MTHPEDQAPPNSPEPYVQDNLIDNKIISKFINQYADLIRKEPHKAYSVLIDLAGNRDHLAVGSREILNRQEWRSILDEQKSEAEKGIHAHQLRDWILKTFSAGTASPWLEALSHPTKSNNSKVLQSQSAESPKKNWSLWSRYWPLLTGLAISFIAMRMVSCDAQPEFKSKGEKDTTNAGRPSPIRSFSPYGTKGTFTEDSQTDFDRPTEEDEANQEDYNNRDINITRDNGQPNSSQSYQHEQSISSSSRARPKMKTPWSEISQRIENGIITNQDLEVPLAQTFLGHWVQSFRASRETLIITLRTREEANNVICQQVLSAYQSAYARPSNSLPTAILESSRHSGKDSSRGFLPVCRLSGSGRLMLK